MTDAFCFHFSVENDVCSVYWMLCFNRWTHTPMLSINVNQKCQSSSDLLHTVFVTFVIQNRNSYYFIQFISYKIIFHRFSMTAVIIIVNLCIPRYQLSHIRKKYPSKEDMGKPMCHFDPPVAEKFCSSCSRRSLSSFNCLAVSKYSTIGTWITGSVFPFFGGTFSAVTIVGDSVNRPAKLIFLSGGR